MNNEYVTGLHKYLQGQYGSEFQLNEQQFQEKLNNDPEYVNGLYGYLQGQYGSQFTLSPEEFSGKVKKKDQSQSGYGQTQPGSGSSNSQDELLRRAKEMGWNTVEEYKRADWKKNRGFADFNRFQEEQGFGIEKQPEPQIEKIPVKAKERWEDESISATKRLEEWYKANPTPRYPTESDLAPEELRKAAELEQSGSSLYDTSKLSDSEKKKYETVQQAKQDIEKRVTATEIAGRGNVDFFLDYYDKNKDKLSEFNYDDALKTLSDFKKDLQKKYGPNFQVTDLSPEDAEMYDQLSNAVISVEDQITQDYLNSLKSTGKDKEEVEKYEEIMNRRASDPDLRYEVFADANGVLRRRPTGTDQYAMMNGRIAIKKDFDFAEEDRFLREFENKAIKTRTDAKLMKLGRMKLDKPWGNFFNDLEPKYNQIGTVNDNFNQLFTDLNEGKISQEDAKIKYDELKGQLDSLNKDISTTRESYNISEKELNDYYNLMNTYGEESALKESATRKRTYLEELDYATKLAAEKRYDELSKGFTNSSLLIAAGDMTGTFINQLAIESMKALKPIGETFNLGLDSYGWSDKLYDTASALSKANHNATGYEKPSDSMASDYSKDVPEFFGAEGTPLPTSTTLMMNLSNGLGSAFAFMTPTGVASKLIKGAGYGSMISRQILGKGGMFLQLEAQNYERNLKAGMSADDAAELSILQSLQDVAAESFFNEAAMLGKIRPAGFISALRSGVSKREAFKAGMNWLVDTGKSVAKSATMESIEEGLGQLSQDVGAKEAELLYNNRNYEDIFQAKAYANSMVAGALTGGFLDGVRALKPMSPSTIEALNYAGTNAREILQQVAIFQNEGKIDQKKYRQIEESLNRLSEITQSSTDTPGFSELSQSDKNAFVATLFQLDQLNSNTKQLGIETEKAKKMKSILQQRATNILEGKRTTDEGNPLFRTYMDRNLQDMGVAVVDVQDDGSFNLYVAPGLNEQDRKEVVSKATAYLQDKIKNDAIVAAKFQPKIKTDAVQESSTEEVLPRQQGATTETGGQPQGMGQSVQGQEATQQGQEVSQENIEANIADIEKRRQEELDNYTEEELNEVYAVGSTDTVGDRINARYDLEVDKANETQKQATTQKGQEVSQEGVKPELENNPELIEQRRIETQSQIERTDLFDGVGDFSSELGGSDKAAVPTNRQKINGIEFVQYSHPETGSLDVIVTGTSDNDFVGFYRVYENGKPTNKWSSKFENQSRNKENFKTMISNAQDMLPEGHEYMEKTSISTDGLRVWNQQLDRGYELQYDENGKLKTNLVAINGDAIVNELGIPVNKGDFDNIRVSNKEDFEKVKKVLLPYLEKFGLDESNIRWLTGTVKIDLPVLVKSPKKQEVGQESIEAKKADIERRRQEELSKLPNGGIISSGDVITTSPESDKINAIYDAELAALEGQKQAPTNIPPSTQQAPATEEKLAYTGNTAQDRVLKEKYKADGLKRRILDQAQRIASALGKNTQVYVYETTEEYNAAIAERLGEEQKESTNGRFLYGDGVSEIHIDLSKANEKTLPHEAVHAALYKAFGDNEKLFQQFKDKLKPLLANSTVTELENFANQETYIRQGVTAEEFLAELGGVMTAAGNRIPKTTLQKITQLLNEFLSKITGGRIAPLSTGEVIDLFNSMAEAFASGKSAEIKSKRTIDTGKQIQSKLQADFSDPISKLTFVYDKNSKEFERLEKEGYITNNFKLDDFDGKFMFLHQPDAAFSGMIYKDNELLVEGKGGMFYPIKFHKDGYFWASTGTTAEKMAKDLNKVLEQNNGTIYMALTSAPYDKLMSSTTMSNAVLDFFSSKAFDNNFKVTPAQLKVALRKAANDIKIKKSKDKKTGKITEKRIGLGLKIKSDSTLEDIQSQIKTALNPDVKSFADRKNFTEELIRLMAENIKNNPKATEQFGKLFSEGIQNKYFKGETKTGKLKISAANMTQALSEMFTEPILKEGVEREKGGQVYAVIELNGAVKAVDSNKHESYPKAIQSDDSKNKVKIHVLQDRKNWAESFIDPETGETITEERQKQLFPTSGVSVTGLQLKSKSQVSAIPKATTESRDMMSEFDMAANKSGLAKDNSVRRFVEKYGEKGLVAKEINDNFEKIQEQLGITKICNI
jgi:hypothetical protein